MPRTGHPPWMPFACYHYRRRVAARRRIVCSLEEIDVFLARLASSLRRAAGAKLHAFYLDAEQVHLVIRAGTLPLIPALGVFCHGYTRDVNRVRDESGALFSRRAHVTLFQTSSWLLPIARYVHSIRPPAVAPLFASSDWTYRHSARMRGLTTSVVRRVLERQMENAARSGSTYDDFFDPGPDSLEVRSIERGSSGECWVLGDHRFIADIQRRHTSERDATPPRGATSDQRIECVAERVIALIHALCNTYLYQSDAQEWICRTTVAALRSRSRKVPLPFVRALIADHAMALDLATVGEVERYFRLRPKSLAAGLRGRYRARLQAQLDRLTRPLQSTSQISSASHGLMLESLFKRLS